MTEGLAPSGIATEKPLGKLTTEQKTSITSELTTRLKGIGDGNNKSPDQVREEQERLVEQIKKGKGKVDSETGVIKRKGHNDVSFQDPDYLWLIANTLYPKKEAEMVYQIIRTAQLQAMDATFSSNPTADQIHQEVLKYPDSLRTLNGKQMMVGDDAVLDVLDKLVTEVKPAEKEKSPQKEDTSYAVISSFEGIKSGNKHNFAASVKATSPEQMAKRGSLYIMSSGIRKDAAYGATARMLNRFVDSDIQNPGEFLEQAIDDELNQFPVEATSSAILIKGQKLYVSETTSTKVFLLRDKKLWPADTRATGPTLLKKGDQIIMCSRELWQSSNPTEMVRILSQAKTTEEAGNKLIYASGSESAGVSVIRVDQLSGKAPKEKPQKPAKKSGSSRRGFLRLAVAAGTVLATGAAIKKTTENTTPVQSSNEPIPKPEPQTPPKPTSPPAIPTTAKPTEAAPVNPTAPAKAPETAVPKPAPKPETPPAPVKPAPPTPVPTTPAKPTEAPPKPTTPPAPTEKPPAAAPAKTAEQEKPREKKDLIREVIMPLLIKFGRGNRERNIKNSSEYNQNMIPELKEFYDTHTFMLLLGNGTNITTRLTDSMMIAVINNSTNQIESVIIGDRNMWIPELDEALNREIPGENGQTIWHYSRLNTTIKAAERIAAHKKEKASDVDKALEKAADFLKSKSPVPIIEDNYEYTRQVFNRMGLPIDIIFELTPDGFMKIFGAVADGDGKLEMDLQETPPSQYFGLDPKYHKHPNGFREGKQRIDSSAAFEYIQQRDTLKEGDAGRGPRIIKMLMDLVKTGRQKFNSANFLDKIPLGISQLNNARDLYYSQQLRTDVDFIGLLTALGSAADFANAQLSDPSFGRTLPMQQFTQYVGEHKDVGGGTSTPMIGEGIPGTPDATSLKSRHENYYKGIREGIKNFLLNKS